VSIILYQNFSEKKKKKHEKNKINLNIIGLKGKISIDDQIEFVNVIDKETQQKLTLINFHFPSFRSNYFVLC